MQLNTLYHLLFNAYGPQYWWPADTTDEIIIGAVLTQNTAWTNVEKAINNLKLRSLCNLKNIEESSLDVIAQLIRPSGYYNVKANRLKSVTTTILKYDWNSLEDSLAREILLSTKGIGPETADSILLYALNKYFFVVDAYTIRILSRLGVLTKTVTYNDCQNIIMQQIDSSFYNEFHALFVHHAKTCCLKKPLCNDCVIKHFCIKDL